MAVPRPQPLLKLLLGIGGVVCAAIALAGDAPSPLFVELQTFERRLEVVFYPSTEASGPSLLNEETDLFKDLVSIGDKIRVASEKATPETLLEIQQLTTEWTRLRMRAVDESLRKYYRGRGDASLVRMWAEHPLKLARTSVEKLIPENPFVFQNVDAAHVGLIVSEHDLSLKEFGVLVSEPGIKNAYEKILQFASLRTEMINRWAYQRIGMASAQFPYQTSDFFNPISLSNDHGQALVNELWTNDAFDSWQSSDLQNALTKQVLTHLETPDLDALVLGVENTFSSTDAYRDFFDMVPVELRRERIKKWITDNALKNRTLRLAGAAPSIIGSAFLPKDDTASKELPIAETATFIARRIETVEQDEVTESLLATARDAFKIKTASYKAKLLKEVDSAFEKSDQGRQVALQAVLRAHWKSPRLAAEMKVRLEKKLEGYAQGTKEFYPIYVEWKKVSIEKKSTPLAVADPRHNLILSARELQAYFIFRLAKENDALKWRYDHSPGMRDIFERYFKALEMAFEALPTKDKTGAKLSALALQTSQAFQKFYQKKDAEIAEADRKAEAEELARKDRESRRFGAPILHKADGVVNQAIRKPIPTSFLLPDYFALLNLKGANAASVRVLKTNADLALYLEHKVLAFKAAVPLSRETWSFCPPGGGRAIDLDVLEHLRISAWDHKTKTLNLAIARTYFKKALDQAFRRHEEYSEQIAVVNLLKPNSEPFRKLLESTAALREILIQFRAEMRQTNPFLEDFAAIDKNLVEDSKTIMERVYFTGQMILMGIVILIVVIGAVKLTVVSFGLAGPAIFISAMGLLSHAIMPLTAIGVYSALQVHLVEKPQSIAYQEMLMGSRIAEGSAKSYSSFASRGNEAIAALLNQKLNTDEKLTEFKDKERTQAYMDVGFAALDAAWLFQLARTSSGWKAVEAYQRLKTVSNAPSMTRVMTHPSDPLMLVKPPRAKATQTIAAEIKSPSVLKKTLSAIDVHELKLAKIAETLGDNLDTFSRELSTQITGLENGLKTNGELARKFNLSEISAHPELTDFRVYSRALTGKNLDLSPLLNYDWRGAVTMTEIYAFRTANARQWLTKYGKLRQIGLKLKGLILKEELITPLKTIQAKKRMIMSATRRGASLDQWAATFTKTPEQIARWKNAIHDGDRLMAVITPAELDALEKVSQTASFMERFLFIDRIQNWIQPTFLRKLHQTFQAAADVTEYVPRSVYNPDRFLSIVEKKIEALGNSGDEVSNYELYEKLLRGEIDPTDSRIVSADFRQYKEAMDALERGRITSDEVEAAAAEFEHEFQAAFAGQ